MFYRLWIQLFICKWTTKLYFLAFDTQCAINRPAGVCQFRFVRQLPFSLSDISSYYIYSWMLQRPVTKWNITLNKNYRFLWKTFGTMSVRLFVDLWGLKCYLFNMKQKTHISNFRSQLARSIWPIVGWNSLAAQKNATIYRDGSKHFKSF